MGTIFWLIQVIWSCFSYAVPPFRGFKDELWEVGNGGKQPLYNQTRSRLRAAFQCLWQGSLLTNPCLILLIGGAEIHNGTFGIQDICFAALLPSFFEWHIGEEAVRKQESHLTCRSWVDIFMHPGPCGTLKGIDLFYLSAESYYCRIKHCAFCISNLGIINILHGMGLRFLALGHHTPFMVRLVALLPAKGWETFG